MSAPSTLGGWKALVLMVGKLAMVQAPLTRTEAAGGDVISGGTYVSLCLRAGCEINPVTMMMIRFLARGRCIV